SPPDTLPQAPPPRFYRCQAPVANNKPASEPESQNRRRADFFSSGVRLRTATAIRGIQAAEDNNIALWRVNAFGTPLSAIMRHPDIVPALRMLCLPAGAMESPAL
ncbi:MAG: hypothetical protein M0T76_01560, partial [Desulfobacteraceae bacterium]|nr:hypothetical protein [Desulfobacteraceae bacterium]